MTILNTFTQPIRSALKQFWPNAPAKIQAGHQYYQPDQVVASIPREIPVMPIEHPWYYALSGNMGELQQFGANFIDVMSHYAEAPYVKRSVIQFRVYHLTTVAIFDPIIAHTILNKHQTSLQKDFVVQILKLLIGESVLSMDGEVWQEKRNLAKPLFHTQQLQDNACMMNGVVVDKLATLQSHATYNVNEVMYDISMCMICQKIFGDDAQVHKAEIRQALTDSLRDFTKSLPLPSWLPTARNKLLKKAGAMVDDIIKIYAQQHATATSNDQYTMLSMLLAKRNTQGKPLSHKEIRDEITTMLFAGMETTSTSMAWTLGLLAQHPDKQNKMAEECIQARKRGNITYKNFKEALPYTYAVVQESLRLYPTVWGYPRNLVQDCTVGGYTFKKGTRLLFMPWVWHHDAAYFLDPNAFVPERWSSKENQSNIAYMPFSVGARSCIGREFAMLEMVIVISSIIEQFSVEKIDEHYTLPKAYPNLTTDPITPIELRFVKR